MVRWAVGRVVLGLLAQAEPRRLGHPAAGYIGQPETEELGEQLKVPPRPLEQDVHRAFENDAARETPQTVYQRRRRQVEIALKTQDFDDAERTLMDMLTLPVGEEAHGEVLIELARLYARLDKHSEQAVVLERFIETYPGHPRMPEALMDLGHIYRNFGAYSQALAKFYAVLNKSLTVPKEKIDTYRTLSLRAQFEIAETHFLMKEYEEAIKFYSRLRLLELAESDRAEISFKRANGFFLIDDYNSVVPALKEFIDQFPKSERIAEAHYLLARAYEQTERMQAALAQVLTLLRLEQISPDENPKQFLYWKRKTGNALANEFFRSGDFVSALKIYQAMAPLSEDPAWQAPVIYQIGLCFERLRMPPKAAQAYDLILAILPSDSPSVLESKPLAALREMAIWRLEHMQWVIEAETSMQDILAPQKWPGDTAKASTAKAEL